MLTTRAQAADDAAAASAAGGSGHERRSLPEVLGRIALWVTLLLAPISTVVFLAYIGTDRFALDFHGQFWPVGRRVLDGLSPYDLAWMDIQNDVAFPYNAVAALLFVPFALLPIWLADALYVALCVASVLMTLRILGVRDWRIYAIVLIWAPVLTGAIYGNVSLPLAFGVALLWRYRDRGPVAGLLLALMVSVKLFVWPLAIWLVATRRWAALGYAVLCGLALNLVAWAVIGFDEIGPYIDVLRLVTDREVPRSFSPVRVAIDYGASRPVAFMLTFGFAAVAGLACVVLARRGRPRSSLLLAVAMCLLATPVVWDHYVALLIVPLALLRPRFGLVWALPVAITPVAVVLTSISESASLAGQVALVAAIVVTACRYDAPGADDRTATWAAPRRVAPE